MRLMSACGALGERLVGTGGRRALRSHAGHLTVAEVSRPPVSEVPSEGFRSEQVLVLFALATGATSSWSDAGGVLGPTAFLLVERSPGRERRVTASIAGPSSWRPHAPTKE